VRLAYLDCFSGISGDMALAALIHAGADLEAIGRALEPLPIDGFLIEREDVEDHGILATRIHVKVRPQGLVRTYSSVRQMLQVADLRPGPRRTADRIFHRLAAALARVHGKEPEVVTFHELGEIECLVEIIGSAVALDLLGVDRVFASPIPTGMGMARGEHGMVPVPSPEVVELLQTVPTFSRGIPAELVTPVGAAIVSAVVEGFGDMPMMRADRVGYGAGHPRLDFPNLLRVVIGEEERAEAAAGPGAERSGRGLVLPKVIGTTEPVGFPGRLRLAAEPEDEGWGLLVQATVEDPGDDDARAALLEQLFDAGADDAWLTPVTVRGGHAASIVTATTATEHEDDVVRALQALVGTGAVRVMPVRSDPS
jgi:uncharacterized protein (TIGR00299 family) protein